jgi:hypothetical protein
LLAVFAGPVPAAFAQEQDIAPVMLSRAIAREASRISAEADSPSAASPSAQLTTTAQLTPTADWSRVLTLTPGREIVLSAGRYSRSKQRLLSADSTGLTVLNVGDPAISKEVRNLLVSTAAQHPTYFADADRGAQFVLSKGVLLGPAGVFQAGRRLFDIAHVVERVPRDDVMEVSILKKHIGQHAKRGLLIGAAAGALVGGIGASTCGPDTEPGYCNVGGMTAAGALLGGLMGLEYGTIIGIIVPRSPDVIYRR